MRRVSEIIMGSLPGAIIGFFIGRWFANRAAIKAVDELIQKVRDTEDAEEN